MVDGCGGDGRRHTLAIPCSSTRKRMVDRMPGFIGMPELLLLGLVALVLFGPKRLPEMGRGLGKGMREFKESITGDSTPNDAQVAKLAVAEEQRRHEAV
jgi:sec-independent protein translocase protein TatA